MLHQMVRKMKALRKKRRNVWVCFKLYCMIKYTNPPSIEADMEAQQHFVLGFLKQKVKAPLGFFKRYLSV